MEEPDRGQGKAVIELNNGKQEKTTAVEVHTLHKLLCEREVKSEHVAETWLRTHRYIHYVTGASPLLCLLLGQSPSTARVSLTGRQASPCTPLPSAWSPGSLDHL